MKTGIRRFIGRYRGVIFEGMVLIGLGIALAFAVNAEMDFMSGNRVVVAGAANVGADNRAANTIRHTPRIGKGLYDGP